MLKLTAIRVVDGGGTPFTRALRIDPMFAVAPTEIPAAARESEALVLWNAPAALAGSFTRAARCTGARAAVVVFCEEWSESAAQAALEAGARYVGRITGDAAPGDYRRVIRLAVRAERFNRRRLLWLNPPRRRRA